jgi:hypothetical protein
MKDITDYILFLVEGCGLPVDIKRQEGENYILTITKDLKGSSVLYEMAMERSEPNIKYVRNQVKKYLSGIKVEIKVEYINYPKLYSLKLSNEYKYNLIK